MNKDIKQDIVDTHILTPQQAEELVKLAEEFSEGHVKMLSASGIDNHMRFLRKLEKQTGIPRPVIEYFLFGTCSAYL